MSGRLVDPVAFVLARLEEDEGLASAAGVSWWGHGQMKGFRGHVVVTSGFTDAFRLGLKETSVVAESTTPDAEQKVQHIALWNPKRVLTEIQIKRRLIGMRGGGVCNCADTPPPGAESGQIHHLDCAAWQTARLLAVAWRRHPDYQESWTPPECGPPPDPFPLG